MLLLPKCACSSLHMKSSAFLRLLGFIAALFAQTCVGAGLGSAFSYQGRLLESGAPANGRYDLRFEFFTLDAGGVPSAQPITNSAVLVSNGVFATSLDFGTGIFSGTAWWLEIGVRPAGVPDPFVTLAPRQSLTPAPYSIYTLKAESLSGLLSDAQLSTNVARLDANQTFGGAVTFA